MTSKEKVFRYLTGQMFEKGGIGKLKRRNSQHEFIKAFPSHGSLGCPNRDTPWTYREDTPPIHVDDDLAPTQAQDICPPLSSVLLSHVHSLQCYLPPITYDYSHSRTPRVQSVPMPSEANAVRLIEVVDLIAVGIQATC